jgi:cytochrome c biogenesis protein CcmG, thiol:disulfide interchange protein DsbE
MKRLAPWLLASALGLGWCPLPAGAAELPGPVVGRPAPPFTLTTTGGKHVSLADYRGKTLVVNVWGSWCPPCRLETPDLIAEAKAGASRGVAFLGIDTTEPASAVRAFVAAKGIPYPQAVTPGDGEFARAYDIRNYPTTFVIDPSGVLRARHADNVLPRAQLRAYIAAAQRGVSAPLTTAFQRSLDALLDPAQYRFAGAPEDVRAGARAAAGAIDKVNDLLDDAMNDPSRDHDLVATQQEQETLREATIAALAPVAESAGDRALLARLRGDEAAALGRWPDAGAAYAGALAIDPKDTAALGGQAYAATKLGDDARVAQIDAQLAQIAPSAAAFVALGRAYGRLGKMADAETAFERAQQLAATEPAQLARTNLYYGRTEMSARNAAKARAAFERAAAAAQRVPKSDPRAEWYVEQAQEGMIALGVSPGARPALSLAPWTGPDLPGSIASTLKYRLVMTGAPGSKVHLAASGLPKHWIGSFCTDRVCAPFRVSFVVPADGVKIIEFQVVPAGTAPVTTNVRIQATSAGHPVASVATSVRV